MTSLHIVEK